MRSWKTPTPEQVERAIALMKKAQHYRYFFERLKNPMWIEPLRNKDFLKHPPAPVRDQEKRTITFPLWPESRYLARMAALDPKSVLQIILDIPDTENVRVHEDFTDAALAMPAEFAVQLVPQAKEWIKNPYQLLLLEKFGALVEKLAKEGQVDAAFELAAILLEVIRDPKKELESRARFEEWEYRKILKERIPSLVATDGVRTVRLLCNLLARAIMLEERGNERNDQDYSYIWRPAIENHSQNLPHSIKDALVTALRDAAEAVLQAKSESGQTILDTLEARPYRIFKRLGLYLLRQFPTVYREQIAIHLTDHDLFDDLNVRHEYFLLLKEQFPNLSREAQGQVLRWIERGLNLEQYKASTQSYEGRRPTDEEAKRYQRHWQLHRLISIKDALPTKWRLRYEELLKEFGEPEHPEFVSHITTFVGPTSPKSGEELRAMSISDVIDFLKTWQWPKEDFAPSPEGLGRELCEVVASKPRRFADEAMTFKSLEPTYVRAFLSGLREACKADKPFNWMAVVDLCRWVMQQPREILGRKVSLGDADPDWGWARKTVADLLEVGFEEKPSGISFDLRKEVWQVLEPLTDDPEPTPEYEEQYGGTNMDPATLSINTVRGVAMHAVIRYALWCRRNIEKGPDGASHVARGFDELPEVRAVLDKHLNIEADPSLTVRSVYGRWLPWLVLLDCDWVTKNLSRIFPKASEAQLLRDTAWETYIIFCPVYDNVFAIVQDEYKTALERIGTPKPDRRLLDDPDRKLAEHLMVLYWRGKVPLDGRKALLQRLFSNASDALRADAIAFIGRSLENRKNDISAEILKRLKKLWDFRVATVRASSSKGEYAEEMAAFGWWFVSKKFDWAWTLSQLQIALDLSGGKVEPDHLVVENLAENAETSARDCVICLTKIVKGDREGWGIYGWRDAARKIIQTALESADNEARNIAEDLVHDLGALGRLEFRDLLVK